MRQLSRFVVGCCLLLASETGAQAQDLPTTHDHGITITPEDLTDAIQETQDFWGPVRKHLLGDECAICDVTQRHEAVAFLKKIHDGLHHRLFEMTETEAVDLIDYLGHRLRMFEVYRRLRTAIGDDARLASLVDTWEHEFRHIHADSVNDRATKIDALLARMNEDMQAAGLAEAKIAEAAQLWRIQALVVEQMAATGAGRMMIAFENEAKQLPLPVGDTLLRISQAADWVLITREKKAVVGRDEFLKAFASLDDFRARRTAAAPPGLNR